MIDLASVRRVWVWTTNPIKVAAVQDVFNKLWLDVSVTWFNTQSHVSDMPLSIEETLKWSHNRASALIEKWMFDMAFWLEWWVEFTQMPNGKSVCMLFWWTTIIDSTGYESSWSTGNFPIPSEVAFALEWWAELWTYMAEKTWIDHMKKKWWTIWYLTRDHILRQEAFYTSWIHAIVPWLNKELYE